ncbi:ATP-binding protein [Faunimonas pinastri]|nr:ATP-binding protein [Faunimonas pinastri]
MRTGIDMGTASPGGPATLDLEELLSTRLLVQGNSGSGKSHLLRRLLEQSAGLVQQVIIDPEGDFVSLAEHHGHVVVEADRTEADLQRIALRVRQHRISVVLNLEELDAEAQMRSAAAFLNGLFEADRSVWYPVLVVVDEAQLFAPAIAGDVSDEARKVSLGAMTNLMCRGRKRGLAGVIATQRLAKLAKNVAAEASNFLMGRTFLDIDMARAADLLGLEKRQAEKFRDLDPGQFIALGPALFRRPAPIRIGDVMTAGRSGRPTLLPLPETPSEDRRDLVFTRGENEPLIQVPPRRATPVPTADVLAQLARSLPAQPAPVAEPEPELPDSEKEAAIEEILGELLSDPEAAFAVGPALFQEFLLRCRIRRISGEPLSLNDFRRRLAVSRAGISVNPEQEAAEWERALAVSTEVPDDVQGLFLLVARAALDRAPCPSDADLAKAYGTRSPARARRLLTYLESRGFVVVQADMRNRRIVSLPHLGWETAPGDPNVGAAPSDPILAQLAL